MSERIPQSIAKRVVFRAYLASDGKTPATGKTIAITISKNGGAFGNPAAGATNATAISSGFYYFDLGTGDTGTQGPLAWRGAEGTIDDAGDVYEVVNATNAGFTALPNAAADAAGGLPVSDAGGLDLDARLDAAITSRMASYTQPTGFLAATFPATVASTTNITAGTITTVTNLTNLPTIPNNWITAAGIASGAIDAAAVAADTWQELIEAMFTYNATADYAGATAGSIVKEIADNAGGSSLTAADIADAVWDEILSGHAISGSTGEALGAAGGAGDPWITVLPGSYSAGQAGYILGTYLDAAMSTRSTYSGADTSGTTTLLSRLTATRAGYLDNLSGGAVALASSILNAAGLRSALGLASANLDTQLGDLPTANENADALLNRNVAGGSSSGRLVKEALYFLRNKWTSIGGTLTVYGTDDTTSAWTALLTQGPGDPVSAVDPT
jgi:hypothetical protein